MTKNKSFNRNIFSGNFVYLLWQIGGFTLRTTLWLSLLILGVGILKSEAWATNPKFGPKPTPPITFPRWECSSQGLRKGLAPTQHPWTTREFAILTKNFFHNCEAELHGRFGTNDESGFLPFTMGSPLLTPAQELTLSESWEDAQGLLATPFNLNLSSPPKSSSEVKKFSLTLENGHKINGLVRVFGGEKRPWIVGKCGVFCSIDQNGVNHPLYAHFMGNTPFNVIFLSNRTGEDYIQDNGHFHIGGYFEAEDLLEVSRWLVQSSPYRETVDSIHLMGVSLGGSSVVMANNLISRHQIDPVTQSFIRSSLAICPVTNLKPSLEGLYEPGIKGYIARFTTWTHLQRNKSNLRYLSNFLNIRQVPFGKSFANLIAKMGFLESQVYKPILNLLQPPKTMETFWLYNNYLARARNAEIPLLLWASDNDPIVPAYPNSGLIEDSVLAKFYPTIGVVRVPHGRHCSFADYYGVEITAQVITTFILQHSYSNKVVPN